MARVGTAVKTQSKPINIGKETAGPLVPYKNPVPSQSPQVITPQPVGTYSKPSPSPVPKPKEVDIIDAEIVRPQRVVSDPRIQRRPVVSQDGKTSPESRSPQSHPAYPDPSAGWKSFADFLAWQNGTSRETIDAEREAYEFTKNWGATGGLLYPLTDAGPRSPIISDNYVKANRFRARHGLPAIDRFGYEQAQPMNPSVQPGRGFQSNPFKTDAPIGRTPATPSNFDESPYNFDIDPDTGKPYTDLQRRRGDELGRPPWHINPTTGNPWGSDEPGVPIPLPFDGAPGGVGKYPIPDTSVKVAQWAITLELTHSYEGARGRGRYTYYVAGEVAPIGTTVDIGPQETASVVSNGTARILDFRVNGDSVASNGSGDLNASGEWEPFGVSWGAPYPTAYVGTPVPGGNPTFTPIGAPLPTLTPTPTPTPTPAPSPKPTQDPRVNPTIPKPLPYAPTKTLPENPNTLPQVPFPYPSPSPNTLPDVPGSPVYAPNPGPYPRRSPTGQPQPNLNPSGQPQPARPSNPAPTVTIDRPKNPPVNPGPGPGDCDPCPDPCDVEEVETIRYKKFVGCNVTATGLPDRFREGVLSVPSSSATAIKSMLDSLADIQAQECEPCCYWDIDEGPSITLFAGIPNPVGQEFAIAKGIARVDVTFNAVEALNDNTLRSLKRIVSDGNPVNTFVNVAAIHLITDDGMDIATRQLWTVGTSVEVPFEYRHQNMKLRLMPKSTNVNFTIVDSGRRWVQRRG